MDLESFKLLFTDVGQETLAAAQQLQPTPAASYRYPDTQQIKVELKL